ncbi:uncharacterized protein LOC106051465 [Biomphalaria glabrata]|uniref:Uncharacterized protein LOC106051465 n=1 Tax=Biomphalaria glabrata TaxID=6526 RepID=A0A9U8DUT4_BIOGL|nr:uncharacterized protein LOC106051465 [Biomphalaria glabrata]KAI8739553.1 protein daughter of sevenless-like [Biomphalaria glabrata]KAI8771820.1 protein daughter of sevenless [Biomphalaria glabrata]
MMGVLYRGWLTKSPPEKKLGNHIKLFRAKWKRRFFVMTVKDGRHELAYYKDQSCQNKKGTVNLKDCKSASRVLQTNVFPNLLALKTISKNKPRTYYLAAEHGYEVDNWLHWLHLVCGIKEEESSTKEDDPKTMEHLDYNPPEITLSRSSNPQDDSVQCSDVSVQLSIGDADSEENPYSEVDSPKAERKSSPKFADFIQYLNDSLTVAEKLGEFPLSSRLSGSNTSMETKTGLEPPEATLDLPIYSNDQRQHQKGRAVSDYDVPRSTLVKGCPPILPLPFRRSNLSDHIYVNTSPMAHLDNPEI